MTGSKITTRLGSVCRKIDASQMNKTVFLSRHIKIPRNENEEKYTTRTVGRGILDSGYSDVRAQRRLLLHLINCQLNLQE